MRRRTSGFTRFFFDRQPWQPWGFVLTPSLSVIVPMHNAERTLARLVGQLLDLLPDLTPRFEILLVDDGSSDQTLDIAGELSRQYPQVKVARHYWQWGEHAAARTGTLQASGQIALVLQSQEEVDRRALSARWHAAVKELGLEHAQESERRRPAPVARWEGAHLMPASQSPPSFVRHLSKLSVAAPSTGR